MCNVPNKYYQTLQYTTIFLPRTKNENTHAGIDDITYTEFNRYLPKTTMCILIKNISSSYYRYLDLEAR